MFSSRGMDNSMVAPSRAQLCISRAKRVETKIWRGESETTVRVAVGRHYTFL